MVNAHCNSIILFLRYTDQGALLSEVTKAVNEIVDTKFRVLENDIAVIVHQEVCSADVFFFFFLNLRLH